MSETMNVLRMTDQKLTDEQKELVQLVYERLEMFMPYCREHHQKVRDCRNVLRFKDPYFNTGDRKKVLQL